MKFFDLEMGNDLAYCDARYKTKTNCKIRVFTNGVDYETCMENSMPGFEGQDTRPKGK